MAKRHASVEMAFHLLNNPRNDIKFKSSVNSGAHQLSVIAPFWCID